MAWAEFGQIMCVVEDIGGRPFPICLWRREIWAACPTRQSREKLREIWKRHETAKEIPPDIQGPPFVIGPEEGGPKDQLMPEKDFSSVDPFSCYRQGLTRLVRESESPRARERESVERQESQEKSTAVSENGGRNKTFGSLPLPKAAENTQREMVSAENAASTSAVDETVVTCLELSESSTSLDPAREENPFQKNEIKGGFEKPKKIGQPPEDTNNDEKIPVLPEMESSMKKTTSETETPFPLDMNAPSVGEEVQGLELTEAPQ